MEFFWQSNEANKQTRKICFDPMWPLVLFFCFVLFIFLIFKVEQNIIGEKQWHIRHAIYHLAINVLGEGYIPHPFTFNFPSII